MALRYNAAAFIEAYITYKTADGTIKTLEINDNRYGVIFAGSELPDGTKADAVYITLSSWFRELQNRVQLRPLDYDYLKATNWRSAAILRNRELCNLRLDPARQVDCLPPVLSISAPLPPSLATAPMTR